MSLAAASPAPPRVQSPARTQAGAQAAARASAHAAFLQWLDQEDAEPPVSGGTATQASSRPVSKPPSPGKPEGGDAGSPAARAQEAAAAPPGLVLPGGLPLASTPAAAAGVAAKDAATGAQGVSPAPAASVKTPSDSPSGPAGAVWAGVAPDDGEPVAQTLETAASGPGGGPSGGSAAQPLLQAAADAGATLVRAKAEPDAPPVAPTLPFDGAPPDGSAPVLSSPLREGSGNPAPGLARTRGAAPSAAAAQTARPVGAASTSASAGDALTLSPAAAHDGGDAGGDGQGAGDPGQDGASADGPAPGEDPADLGLGAAGQTPLAASPTVQAAPAATPLSATAADLAAQMAARVSTGASRFQLQLDPLGLGRVEVNVSIGADRQLTAQLAFADAQTARALSVHAGELRSALEQAGFSVPAHGFDFTAPAGPSAASAEAGGFGLGGGSAGQDSPQPGGGRGASAVLSAGETLAGATAASASAWADGGGLGHLDIRI